MSPAASDSEAAALVSQYVENFDGWTSDQFEAKAKDFARNADLNEPINRAPSSIAAGAIYAAGLVVNEKRTQPEVAEACDVSAATIRKAYVDILEAEGWEVEPRSESGPEHTGIARVKHRLSAFFGGGSE